MAVFIQNTTTSPVCLRPAANDRARFLFLGRRQEAFTLRLLASRLAAPPDRLGFLPNPPLGGLLIGAPCLHLAEQALALHLLFEDTKSLIDIVVAYKNLQWMIRFWGANLRTPFLPLLAAGGRRTECPAEDTN